ncbi:MAG: hypothetical protein ACRC1K_02780, partial [Planctomycetia bacterium]
AVAGAVVSADAMFTHRDFAARVRAAGGHYILFAKRNQATLKQDVELLLAAPVDPALPPSAAAAGGGRPADASRRRQRARPA